MLNKKEILDAGIKEEMEKGQDDTVEQAKNIINPPKEPKEEDFSENDKLKLIKAKAKKDAKIFLAGEEDHSKEEQEEELEFQQLKLSELQRETSDFASDFELEQIEKHVMIIEGLEKMISGEKDSSESDSNEVSSSDSSESESSTPPEDAKSTGGGSASSGDAEATTEVNKVEEQVDQRNQSNQAKEIEEVNRKFERKKKEAKEKYEKKVKDVQTNPPRYKFFSGNGFFYILAGIDSILSGIPVAGFLLQPVLFAVAMIGWFIPCLLLASPLTIIGVFFFYLIDFIFSFIMSFIPIPVVGGIGDLIPEYIASKRMKKSPNKLIAAAEDRYAEKKIHSLEEKFKKTMSDLEIRHQKNIDKINALYDGKKLALFSKMNIDIDVPMQHMVTGALLLLTMVLTWLKIIGISYPIINMLQLLFTGLFLMSIFFVQKVGLIPIE
jgi:hypothetical protein